MREKGCRKVICGGSLNAWIQLQPKQHIDPLLSNILTISEQCKVTTIYSFLSMAKLVVGYEFLADSRNRRQ